MGHLLIYLVTIMLLALPSAGVAMVMVRWLTGQWPTFVRAYFVCLLSSPASFAIGFVVGFIGSKWFALPHIILMWIGGLGGLVVTAIMFNRWLHTRAGTRLTGAKATAIAFVLSIIGFLHLLLITGAQ